ncbi:MAG TPA: TetR/AcrR family transcriptional regulator [Acidobacteriaceae bacterium]|nr:TetR/AcrR family transcriptional regulator [Acidobacteriaceae bacterium]
MDAILEATLQVLLVTGKERLTTTRVAERAGVSVGTLYQYFPNKSSLLQAVLKRHFDAVAEAVVTACAEQHGRPLAEMVAALASAFLRAKLRDGKGSVALYAVSADVDGVRLVQQISGRLHTAVAEMLRSAPDAGALDADLVTTVMRGAISGVSRQMLESNNPERMLAPLEAQLTAMLRAYLASCTLDPAAATGRAPER